MIQYPRRSPGGRGTDLRTRICHSSGQWLEGQHPIVPQRNDPQGIKSAITYACRTCLHSMIGVAPADDDDGNDAVGKAPAPQQRQPVGKAPSGPAKSPRPSGAVQSRGRAAYAKGQAAK